MSNRCRTLLFFFVPIIAILSAVFFAASAFADERGGEEATTVFVMRVSGMISPVASDFVASSLRKAADIDAQIIILELDTPGGLDTSMRAIVKEMNASRTPIVVYVAPSGARAASAGAFITIAAHVAAMSPGTNIGAAHPVAVGEKMDPVMAEKATNDAAAYIRSLAEQHGRNAVWAEDAVRKSISATESEALKLGVIDLIATDRADLMKQLDGRVVRTAAGNISLRTAKPVIINEEMGFRHRLLSFVSDPTVAYLLMMIGFYGIFFELSNPGTIAPGIIGAISLVLAFYAFQTLPVNYAGLILIVIGIILFVLEIKVTSYGLLTLGGISCLTL
ncbi:MAG TPA: nodulation protein NfeD, partial [Dissulfurispiraceae bacterium]|nr:nodulation protein NfeD [Dissulfurispiraceae bacterium]